MTIKESSIHNKVSNYGYIIAAISLFCYCLHWWLCIVSAVCNWKGVTVLGNREFTSKYLPRLSWWHPPPKKVLYYEKSRLYYLRMETYLWLMTPKKNSLILWKKDGDSIFTKINLHSISKSDCWMRNIPCYNDILN